MRAFQHSLSQFIYFDNAATTFCSRRVLQALSEFYAIPHGNPSAIHGLGFNTAQLLSQCRNFFAKTFGVKPERIVFTASGTEANNLSVSGILKKPGMLEKRPLLLASPIEHSSVMKNLEAWGKHGFELQSLRVNHEGRVDLDDLEQRLSSRVALVSVMAVNNEIGTIEPIHQIGAMIKKKDPHIIFHVDAVQAFGKIPLDFNADRVDLMTLSSHKIHGPVGSGALVMREGIRLEPLFFGGGQEHGIRSGTESVGMIYGFFVAAQEILQTRKDAFERVRHLRDKLKRGIENLAFKKKIHTPQESSPYILNVSFPGFPSEVLLRMLEEEKILVSAGSSCNMKRKKPSGVLAGIGCSESEMMSALRFSFSSQTTESEIEQALEALPRVLERLHRVKF